LHISGKVGSPFLVKAEMPSSAMLKLDANICCVEACISADKKCEDASQIGKSNLSVGTFISILGSKGVCHVTAKEAENGPEEQSDGHV